MKHGGLGAAVAAGAVLAAACAGGGGGSSGSTSTTPPAGAPTSSSAPPGNRQVTVTMSEFRLDLPQRTYAAGTYSFVASNVGHTVHALEIDGPGVSDQRTPGTVGPGQSATLTVTLQAGSYEVYCPVDHHKDMGMDTHITVGGAGGATPPTSAPASTGGSGSGY